MYNVHNQIAIFKMKLFKIRQIVLVVLVCNCFATSCNDDTDEDNKLPLTVENIVGNWNIKEIIKPDGSKVEYVNLCATTKDRNEFNYASQIKFYQTSPDCTYTGVMESCSNYYFMEYNLNNCTNLVNGEISTLTATEMQIDYGEVRTFSYLDNGLNSAIGVVLVKESGL
jgi:hypothetical protein